MQPATLLAVLVAVSGINGEISLERPCSCDRVVLDCSNRNWTTLPPSATTCGNARTAQLGGNLLAVFPDGLTSFVTIIAPNNRLTRLPTASQLNSEVNKLELNDNRIRGSSTEFRTLSKLSVLNLEKNNLISLEFLPVQCNLYSLDVSANAISSLAGPLQDCTKLSYLALAKNQITSIPTGFFSKMTKLKYLYLYSNKIVSIPDGTFTGLGALNSLFLNKNKNISLSSGSFQGLSQLQSLDLTFNQLRTLPAGIFTPTEKLEKLNLFVNKLEDLPENIFSGLNEIKELLLWDNDLTQLPVLQNCCGSLEQLNLLGNNIPNPSEQAMRSVLRGKIHTKLGVAPLRPEALRWVLTAENVETFLGKLCSCGGVRKGASSVDFCVDITCGAGSPHADWRAAITAVNLP